MINRYDLKKLLILALKIAVGSSAAIYIAETANLQFAASAGSITLLTLLTTKLETLKLSIYRLITFAGATLLAYLTFTHITNDWISYGMFIFFTILLSYLFGVKATVSVNAVIGTHYLSVRTFDTVFLTNELLLVLIGIAIAIVMNLFHDYRGDRREIRKNIRHTEERLRGILEEAAVYLSEPQTGKDVWHDVSVLEEELRKYIYIANEYMDNTFNRHPKYYVDYFEMRQEQCKIIHSLHYELKKMRSMPAQAKIISDYIMYLTQYVVEMNHPDEQLQRLHEIIETMENEPLPQSREEFEARAMLYHVMMDLEEFLKAKRRFVDKLDSKQLKIYQNA